jgi:hypothetical protein
VPSIPAGPTSTVSGNQAIIHWNAPSANGTPIIAYRVYIRQSDETYSLETVNCDGSLPSIVANTQCTIPLDTLTSAPFSLTLGSNINAKLIAVNAYGDSSESSSGGGAVILLVPDAPVTLANDASITTDSQIGLTWQ